MKNVRKFGLLVMAALGAMFLFTQCSDDDALQSHGQVQFEITDAPIDDAQVQGAFVTVSEVRVDGQPFGGFSGKQTIDLLAYQNGQVKSLGLGELEAGTYNNVTLVLDFEQDADGNAPGCYVLTDDNVKHDLSANAQTANEITIQSQPFTVEENGRTNLVIDFDLRKAIKRESSGSSSKYAFVTSAELNSALRWTEKESSGQVEGNCQNSFQYADKVVVYAYQKGTFDKPVEMSGQGASNIEFKNAVTSATVDAQGNFTLSFLPEGEYELVFAAYEDSDNDGRFELAGTLSLEIIGSINLGAVSVNANGTVNIQVIATGLLPI
ncbi:MAG: DUF4382 domain-containing protein [Bacteroidetes bacterium]|nr:MAG: DUF4382 domain-containing protein [Bacteroidota bacterium]